MLVNITLGFALLIMTQRRLIVLAGMKNPCRLWFLPYPNKKKMLRQITKMKNAMKIARHFVKIT